MNLIRHSLIALGLIMLLPAAYAQVNADAAKALAEKKTCMACHKVEAKVVGPALREVAKKYQGVANAQANLIAKLRKGAKGTWGTMAMPAVSKDVSEEDLKTIVTWILSLS